MDILFAIFYAIWSAIKFLFRGIWFVIKHIFSGFFLVIIGIVEFFDGIFDWLRSYESYSFREFIKSIFLFPFKAIRFVFTKTFDFIKWFFKTIFKVIKWFFETFGNAIAWCFKFILFVVTLRFLFGSDEDNKKKSTELFDRLFPKSEK